MAAPDRTRAELDEALEAFRPRIRRHVRTLVRNAADAEDLTQETFLRAHRQLDALRTPEALAAWLFRIASNLCRDFLRPQARRRPAGGDEPGGGADVAADLPGLDELVEQAEMSSCGEELLGRLPPAYRRVLVLHDFQGHTASEIARSLGCAPGAVKIRLHRARDRFRTLLLECCDLYHNQRGALVGARKQRPAVAGRPSDAGGRRRPPR